MLFRSSSQASAADLQDNLPQNAKMVQASTEKFLENFDSHARRKTARTDAHVPEQPDLVVVDPPRAGLGERVARALANMGAPRITYVSCDPATLARDLIPLLAAGYRVEQAHLLDLFPQSYHLESVIQLIR